jgi:glc operon protein GlcG
MHATDNLSHTEALLIIEAIRQKAESEQAGLAAAVVDRHGELVAFLRTDGCRLPSIQIAQNKAYTAAREQISSQELGRRSREEGFLMTNFGNLRYVSWGGGIPLEVNNRVIGAVGVSGLPEEDDIAYARHGIAAFHAQADT